MMLHSYKKCLLALTALASFATACNVPLPWEDSRTLAKIEKAIAKQDYETAQQLLTKAALKTTKDGEFNIRLNEIILNYRAGQCDTALKKIYELNAPSLPIEKRRWLHYFSALSRICDTREENVPTTDQYAQALDDLYLAEFLGFPCQSQISDILRKRFPNCDTFQNDEEKAATTYDKAIPFEPDHALTICPGAPVWLKAEAREREILHLSTVYEALPRTEWPDESSMLPYSQPRIRIFASDNAGKPKSEPLVDETLSLPPTSDINAKTLKRVVLPLPTILAMAGDSPYFIEWTTANQGEAKAVLEFDREVDCRTLDDDITWSGNLLPQTVEPLSGVTYQDLLLCPTRPDHFNIRLAPQKAGFVLIATARPNDVVWSIARAEAPEDMTTISESDTAQADDMTQNNAHQNVADTQATSPNTNAPTTNATDQTEQTDDENLPPQTAEEDAANFDLVNGTQFYHVTMPETQNQSDAPSASAIPIIITFYNKTDKEQTFEISLETTQDTPLDYTFEFHSSQDCQDTVTEPVQVNLNMSSDANPKPEFAYQVGWQCPGTTIDIQPVFTSDKLTGQYTIAQSYFSLQTIQDHDFVFESLLRTGDPRDDDFLTETGIVSPLYWFDHPSHANYVLKRPITKRSILKSTSKTLPAFWIVTFQPNDQQNSNSSKPNDHDQNQDEEQQQNKDQQQQDDKKSPDGDHDNDTPEKHSETEASPQGPGQDTKGDQSTPDASADNKNASQKALNAFEKDRVNESLDSYEEGFVMLPTQGISYDEEKVYDRQW